MTLTSEIMWSLLSRKVRILLEFGYCHKHYMYSNTWTSASASIYPKYRVKIKTNLHIMKMPSWNISLWIAPFEWAMTLSLPFAAVWPIIWQPHVYQAPVFYQQCDTLPHSVSRLSELLIMNTKIISYLFLNKLLLMSHLTHWGRYKMDAISQTTLSNAFSWMKILEFRLKFHWNLFPRFQLIISQH